MQLTTGDHVGVDVVNAALPDADAPLECSASHEWSCRQPRQRRSRSSCPGATISTVGLIPGIRDFATRPLPINLAVSLHAANDELCNELVPTNKRYPIDDLIRACDEYLQVKNRRISFEWAMIDGQRPRVGRRRAGGAVSPSAAAGLRQPDPAQPHPRLPTKGSPLKRVHEFRDLLEALGVNATVRQNRRTDIDAALRATRRRATGDVERPTHPVSCSLSGG